MSNFFKKSAFTLSLSLIVFVSIFTTGKIFNLTTEKDISTNLNKVDAYSNTKYLVPLGENFGLKIYTDGIMVSSFQEIDSNGELICPAKDSGIQVGDYILEINDTEVKSNEDFILQIEKLHGESVKLQIKRQEEIFETTVKPVLHDNSYVLGMWVRDSAGGIGTMTYYDPETGRFAGLGHGVCDTESGELLSLKFGSPTPVQITSVQKGEKDNPGKICGYFSSNIPMGTLYKNCDCGIFGTLNTEPNGTAVEVAHKNEVEIGEVDILSTLETGKTKDYKAKIIAIESLETQTKNFVVQITDEELLSVSGGIVQGMSGSPILQDGKLIGAVTHVFVNDPTKGYGILIENMIDMAN